LRAISWAIGVALFVCAIPAFAGGVTARAPFGPFLTAADLDGDHHPDLATAGAVRRDAGGYLLDISFRLSSFETGVITVRTPSLAGRLSARDLDGDADRDLILESFDREPLAVVVNDGDGHFHQADPGEFREQLHKPDSRSWESLVARSDSLETGESPVSPAAAPSPAATSVEPAAGQPPIPVDAGFARSEHSVRASRAPPALL
jgi:hypothetical protein